MPEPLRVFIGFDERQPISYNLLQHSIVRRASKPVTISPLVLDTLPITRFGLTPFTYTRFLVPWLCDYRGWALFLDCDFLCLTDIADLFDLADEKHAVMAAEFGDSALRFERASVMLFNCGHPDNLTLTPAHIETAKKGTLIDWTDNIGPLDKFWNHLVGYDEPRPDAGLVHFTQGVPAYAETADCEYSDLWRQELRTMNSTVPWLQLMGGSVHAGLDKEGRVVPRYRLQ